MAEESRQITATRTLRAALDQAAQALAGASLDELLAAEQSLAQALACFPHSSTTAAGDRNVLRAEADRVRASLSRCRRLGQSLGEFIRISLSARGRGARYDRSGVATGAPAVARVLQVRG